MCLRWWWDLFYYGRGKIVPTVGTPCSVHTKVRLLCNVLQYHYCIHYLVHKMGTPIENSHILWILGLKQAHTVMVMLNMTPQNEGFWLKLGLLLSLFKHTVCTGNCYCHLYCRNSSLEVEDPYSSFAPIEHLNRYTFMKTDSYCI